MSQSATFRPSNGPLHVRGPLSGGVPENADSYRKDRPSTQSGYRFGHLSHNAFFARHNPHPGRVRHMKGLLDVPICTVSDDGYMSSPKYSLQFPPNSFNNKKLHSNSTSYMPSNAINVNTQLHPIDTITGLQYFGGKPMNFRVFREKAVPRMGLVPVTDAWRDELRALTDAIGLPQKKEEAKAEVRPKTQYSETTGRLVPPPSRAMSRQSSRNSKREHFFNQLQHISEEPDMENMVLQILCQILQTDDTNAAQAWLVSAGDREKALVLDMMRSAMANSDEYYKQHQPEWTEPQRPKTTPNFHEQNGLPATQEDVATRVDRMSFDQVAARPGSQARDETRFMRNSYSSHPGDRQPTAKSDILKISHPSDTTRAPVSNEVFRPSKSRQGSRPVSQAGRPKSSQKSEAPAPRLRFTQTPIKRQVINVEERQLDDNWQETQPAWKPLESTA